MIEWYVQILADKKNFLMVTSLIKSYADHSALDRVAHKSESIIELYSTIKNKQILIAIINRLYEKKLIHDAWESDITKSSAYKNYSVNKVGIIK